MQTVLGELNREQKIHEESVKEHSIEEGKVAWEGLPNEALAHKQILALSLVRTILFYTPMHFWNIRLKRSLKQKR